VKAGLENNSLIILGDRRLDVTYQRLAQALAKTGSKKLEELDAKLNAILKAQIPEIEEWEKRGGSLRPDQFREFIESMKTVDTTMRLMDTFKKEVPEVWKAMVGERDVYMARGLNALPSQFQTVVAVMGLGHLNGVSQSLKGMRWTALAKEACR
jgi:pheromone shutdown protein TraB